MTSWSHEPGEPPPRPQEVRRLTFQDLVLRGSQGAGHVVPLQHVRPGDRQVGLFRPYGSGNFGAPGTEVSLDGLAEHPDVESVVGAGMAIARRPLPHVRELSVAWTDEETLANLPNLRMLVVRAGPEDRPLDVAAVPAGLTALAYHATRTFGSVDAITRFTELEALSPEAAFDSSMKPIASLRRLTWLAVAPGRDVRALAALESLEFVKLRMEKGSLPSLKPFATWRRLRALDLEGKVKSLEGIEALGSLERLRLGRSGVTDLAPLVGHPGLRELVLDGPDRVTEWPPLRLPSLRRLHVDLGDGAPPTLGYLRGCDALEEVTLIGGGARDRDPSPIAELTALRRFDFYGDYDAERVEAVRRALPQATITWQPPHDADRPREPLTPFALPDGTWTIFEDVTGLLGVDSNHEAEDLVRAVVARQDPQLSERLRFDSEGSSFAVTGGEQDLRRVAELIRRVGSRA